MLFVYVYVRSQGFLNIEPEAQDRVQSGRYRILTMYSTILFFFILSSGILCLDAAPFNLTWPWNRKNVDPEVNMNAVRIIKFNLLLVRLG